MPEMHEVDSSNVEAIGHESDSNELYVRFKNYRTYVYYDVEEWVFDEFMNAGSKGEYLNQRIKGVYDYAEC